MAQEREPDKRILLGRIRAAIWINPTEDGKTWSNIEVTRAYREGNEWQHTGRFGRDDLPVVALAASMAYAWIWRQQTRASASSQPEQAGSQTGAARTAPARRAEPCK